MGRIDFHFLKRFFDNARNRRGGLPRRVAALAAAFLLVAAACRGPASVYAVPADNDFLIEGRTANYKFSDSAQPIAPAPGAGGYDAPLVIRKTVEQLEGEGFDERDFELMLTATGYDWETVENLPVNIVFVLDTTSSMGGEDIPETAADNPLTMTSRLDAALKSVNAYITELYGAAGAAGGARTLDTAIASYGKSARVHFAASDAAEIGAQIGASYVRGDVGSFLTGNGNDSFIGNYLVGGGYSSGKGDDSADIYNKAVPLYAAFRQAFSADEGKSTDVFFYDDAGTLTGIVNRASRYSDTNVESGLLMARFLLDNKQNVNDAVNLIMLITDGEANSSSTLSMLENSPTLQSAIASGDADGLSVEQSLEIPDFSLGANAYYEVLMRNTAKLSADAEFVSRLLEEIDSPDEINFFTGVFNNLDRAESDLSGDGKIKGSVTMYPGSVKSAASSQPDGGQYLLELFARHVFWLAEYRTDFIYWPAKKGQTELGFVRGENVFTEYEGNNNSLNGYYESLVWEDGCVTGGRTFTSPVFADLQNYFFSNGALVKDPRTFLVDYREIDGREMGMLDGNANGSNAAKGMMQAAAGRAKALPNTVVYATGIGSAMLAPDELAKVASGPDKFMLCNNSRGAVYQNAAALRNHFAELAVKTALSSIQNVTVTDFIPRREGNAAADDDTFTVKEPYEQTVKARLWYYESGAADTKTAADWVYYSDSAASWRLDASARAPSGDAATQVSYNFGALYSEAVSAEKKSVDFPFKAELRIQIRANEGVLSAMPEAAGGVPDIDTNTVADVTWEDETHGDDGMEYPVPKVYFPPEPTPTPTPTPTPEVTPEPESTPTPTPEITPTPTPDPEPNPTPTDELELLPTPTITPAPTPETPSDPTPTPTPEPAITPEITSTPPSGPTSNPGGGGGGPAPTPIPNPGPSPVPGASPSPSPSSSPGGDMGFVSTPIPPAAAGEPEPTPEPEPGEPE
ncbi:MAG: hypothetical protein LBU58_05480, partial [Clostridiales bacterium]|nr:hypothetical protein [Clostridiales bacterium]